MNSNKIKILLISSDSEEEVGNTKKRIEISLKKSNIDPLIDVFDSCEKAFTKARNVKEMEKYDAFVINAKKSDCFGHSFMDLICGSVLIEDKPKIISSNIFSNNSYDFISSNDYYFFPNKNIIQISKNDFLRQDLLGEIFKTFVVAPPRLFVTYGNDENFTSREIIDEFSKLARVAIPHCKVISDASGLRTGCSLNDFMRNMGSGDGVLLIANEKYFESRYCMKELSIIFPKLAGKIYPIFLDSGKSFFDSSGYGEILKGWIEKKNKIESLQDNLISLKAKRDPTLDSDIEELKVVIDLLPSFREYIKDYFMVSIDLYREERYVDIFQRITNDLSENGFIEFYRNDQELNDSVINFKV